MEGAEKCGRRGKGSLACSNLLLVLLSLLHSMTGRLGLCFRAERVCHALNELYCVGIYKKDGIRDVGLSSRLR